MVFQLGKAYRHSSGTEMKIVGLAETTAWGSALIGEDDHGHLSPVGKTEENAVNWTEITEEEWMKNFNK